MNIRKTGEYFVLSILSMILVYAWFALIRVTDLGIWNHGLRNLLAGIVFVFLAQWATGRKLFHPSWYPGLFIFYFWLGIISYVGVKSGGVWGIRLENLNNDVLTLMPVLIFTFLLECIGSAFRKTTVFLGAFNFLLIGYLSLSAFVYVSYYRIFGVAFSSADMISVLLTNHKEAMEFIQSHMGYGTFAAAVILFILFMGFIAFLIKQGIREGELIGSPSYRLIKKIVVGVLVIASLVTIAHWIPRIFPAWPYHVAHKYLVRSAQAAKSHEKNLEFFKFVGTPEKLPGTVIVVIGESANRHHLKAFNPAYPADTTPWLSSEKDNPDFYLLKNTYAAYPITEKSLSMALTNLNQYNGIDRGKMITLTDAANKAGYHTYFISNQAPSSGNMTLALMAGASEENHTTAQPAGDDKKVMDYIEKIPAGESNFIVIHLEGSHDRYRDRVPPNFEKIHIEGHPDKVNDYDSSIKYTDEVLKTIYQYAKDNLNLQAMVYFGDHGEDMQYFHGDGKFTWDMIYTPCFIYLSPEYRQQHHAIDENLRKNEDKVFTNDLIFDTVCGIMGMENNGYQGIYDISSSTYGLTWDTAVSKYGEIRLKEDSAIKYK